MTDNDDAGPVEGTGQPSSGRYPLPDPGQDLRVALGLVVEVGDLLERHGYPRPAGTDWAELELALAGFLYAR